MPLGRFLSTKGAQKVRLRRGGFPGIAAARRGPRIMFEMLEPRVLLTGEAVPVRIPDVHLDVVIREALNKPNGPITDVDLQSLTSMEASGSDIQSLAGLEHATNLEDLDLSGNFVMDVRPLETMARLRTLDLSDNSIANIGPLAELSNLQRLNLSDNAIRDIQAVADLTQLRVLDIGSNPLDNASVVAGLVGLQELSLAGCGINNVEFLADLTGLDVLDVSYNEIDTVTPLAGLSGLTLLDAAGNLITDIRPLAGLTTLSDLSLADNDIRDVSALVGLTDLRSLDLSWNEIGDATDLAGLTGLVYLDISGCGISNIGFVGGLAKLEELGLFSNAIEDIGPLAGVTSLKHLHLGENQITDIRPLAGLTNLRDVDLFSNRIADIAALAGLTNLAELYIHSNWISDIDVLAGLTKLETIYLGANQITDIGAVSGLPNLVLLDVSHNCLDISDGSEAMRIIGGLVESGVEVMYEPQDSLLTLAGTEGDDIRYVTRDGLDVRVYGTVDGSGEAIASEDVNAISTMRLSGSDGDDTVMLDFTNNSPIPEGGMWIDGGSHGRGANTLLLMGLHDDQSVNISGDRIVIGSRVISFVNMQVIEIATGTVGSLTLTGTTMVSVIASGGPVLKVGTLAIGDEATLDLGANSMVVRGGSNRVKVLQQIETWIRKGRGGGDWQGPGMITSAGRVRASTTLACVINSRPDGTGVSYSTFPDAGGVPVTANDILIRFAWAGDANFDGVISADDYFVVDSGYVAQKRGWFYGDFNYDGAVNADDFFLVDSSSIAQSGVLSGNSEWLQRPAGELAQGPVSSKDREGILAELFSVRPVL